MYFTQNTVIDPWNLLSIWIIRCCFLLISFYASKSFFDITDFCPCLTVTGYNLKIYLKNKSVCLYSTVLSSLKSELMLQSLLDVFIHNYFSLAYFFCQLLQELNKKRVSWSCAVVIKASQKLIEPLWIT